MNRYTITKTVEAKNIKDALMKESKAAVELVELLEEIEDVTDKKFGY